MSFSNDIYSDLVVKKKGFRLYFDHDPDWGEKSGGQC